MKYNGELQFTELVRKYKRSGGYETENNFKLSWRERLTTTVIATRLQLSFECSKIRNHMPCMKIAQICQGLRESPANQLTHQLTLTPDRYLGEGKKEKAEKWAGGDCGRWRAGELLNTNTRQSDTGITWLLLVFLIGGWRSQLLGGNSVWSQWELLIGPSI